MATRERRRALLRAKPSASKKPAKVTAAEKNAESRAVAAKRVKSIDDDVSAFAKAMRGIAKQWKAELVDLVARPGTIENARQIDRIAELQAQVREQLNLLGYERLSRDFVTKSFAESTSLAADAVHAAGEEAVDLAMKAIPTQALSVLRSLNLSEMGDIGTNTINSIVGGVVRNAIAGESKRKIIADIQDGADKFANHAATYADTALSVYDRTVHEAVFRAVGIDRFILEGPKDVKNRQWCADHVGKVYTRAEIDKMDNGTKLMPVWKYAGGWNCRHVWVPWFE